MAEQAPRPHVPSEQASPEQQARALLERIDDWSYEGRLEEALVLCDEALSRFEGSREPAMQVLLVQMGASKALCLRLSQRSAEALPLCDELLQRYEGTAGGELRLRLARVLWLKGHLLEVLDRNDEALRIYDELIQRHEGADDEALRGPVASALLSKAEALRSPEERSAAFGDIVRRFKDSSVPAVRTEAVLAAAQRALALRRWGRHERELLATCDEMLAHVGGAREPSLLSAAALLLSIKANTLEDLNRFEEGLAACDEALRLLENESPLALRDEWARTLLNKAFRLKQLERFEEALACYDTVAHRLGSASEPSLRTRVASARQDKAELLELIGRGVPS